MELTVTRVLNELKLLDSRINRACSDGVFIAAKKNSSDKINGTYTVEEFNNKAKQSLQSAEDLIKRRDLLKTELVKSNATTKVTVAGEEMTVAAAIERKNSINYEKQLLKAMEMNYNQAVTRMNRENDTMETAKEDMIKAMFGNKENKDSQKANEYAKDYEKQNGWSLVDPLKLKDKIEEKRKKIEDFENEVDFVLSESNAMTKIVLPD